MNRFVSYDVSIEVIRAVKPILPIIKRFDADLADQLHRAASSVTLNLAEGARLSGGNQRRHYEIAHGSANEVKGCLDAAEAWGWLDDTRVLRQLLDRQLGLLWGLCHGPRVRKTPAQPE